MRLFTGLTTVGTGSGWCRTACPLLLAVVWLARGSLAAPGAGKAIPATSGQENDIRVVAKFLEARIRRDPDDALALNRLAEIYLRQLRSTGDLSWLDRAETVARQSLAALPAETNPAGLAAQARADFESHRFAAARDAARRLRDQDPDHAAEGSLILGDALVELGEPDQAAEAWQAAFKAGLPALDLETRLARLAWLHGHVDEARAKFSRALQMATDPLSPQPATALWLHVQRGQMAFGCGDWPGAETDYLAAQQIDPEQYTVLDHLAELHAARKQFKEAEALYEKVITRTGGRPEFMQSLGDMLAYAGRRPEAVSYWDRALAAYLKRAATSGLYDHHLAGFYSDSQLDAAEALKWARRDISARQSVFAYDTLAWALFQQGDYPAAVEATRTALALGTPDAHLLDHAATILSRCGDRAGGEELLRRVDLVNPHYYDSFHVHR